MRNSGAFVGNIRHDIGDVTIQYAAEHINCVRADALPTLQPCDLSGTDTVLLMSAYCVTPFRAMVSHRFS